MVWLALRYLLLISLYIHLIMRGHNHLAFAFVTILTKWKIVNTDCSFLKKNHIGFMVLIKNSTKGNSLLQRMGFPPEVRAAPGILLIYDERNELHLSHKYNTIFHPY